MTARVSVIIIFFNAARFIEEAIDSVLAQRYQDWELLLVDDGSTDASTGIAKRYAEQHVGRVRYLAHAGHVNRGMSASRNLGIKHATGELIAFLDADDIWASGTLEEQVAILDRHPEAAMVFGRLFYWFSWTGLLEDRVRDYVEEPGVPVNSLIPPSVFLRGFVSDRTTVPSGLLVRRSAIERHGGFEEEFRGEYEDQAFCAKICLHEPVYVAANIWYHYRQHSESAVAIGEATGATFAARLRFLTWLDGYLTGQHVSDWLLWLALRTELWQFRHPRLYRLVKRELHGERRIRGWIHHRRHGNTGQQVGQRPVYMSDLSEH